jgi:hypothetical protein
LFIWPLAVLIFWTINTPFCALAAAENVSNRNALFKTVCFKMPPRGTLSL